MNLGERITNSVRFEWFFIATASAVAFVSLLLRASQKMPDKPIKGAGPRGRMSPEELMDANWPINARFAAALEQIKRDYVPASTAESPSKTTSATSPAKLQP